MMTKRIKVPDLIKYVSGVGLDPELRAEIHRQRQIDGSPVQQWVAEFHAKLRNPLAVDWGAIASLPEPRDGEEGEDQAGPDDDIPLQYRPRVWRGIVKKPNGNDAVSHERAEGPGDESHGGSDATHPAPLRQFVLPSAMADETIRLCLFNYRDLLAEFAPYGELVRSGDADEPLSPYREPLQRIVCRDWDWPTKREDPAYKDESDLALAIATVLSEHEGELPFPFEAIPVVAAILARIGPDDFCKVEDSP